MAAISTWLDITDRKLAEIDRERLLWEIEGEQLRLRTILDSLPVAVLIFDKAGRTVTANPYARNYWGGTVPSGAGSVPFSSSGSSIHSVSQATAFSVPAAVAARVTTATEDCSSQ